MITLKVDPKKCVGCRACEIACSFHHKKSFNPKIASLRVERDERRGVMNVVLYPALNQRERQKRIPCNRCTNEEQPMCTKYCTTGAIVAVESGTGGT